MGEYERGSTAVVNAYIAPKVTSYLSALDEQLRQLGLPRSLLLLQSNGGAVSVDAGRDAAGDAGPVRPGRRRRRAEGLRRAGRGGQPDLDGDRRHQLRRHGDGKRRGAGRRRAHRSTAITSPRRRSKSTPSARAAAPSPGSTMRACCMSARRAPARGPDRPPTGWAASNPTVTDAQLVLGRLRPGPLAGGAVTLDGALARQAVETKLAKPLGLSVEDAAAGVIRLLEQNLLHAVERLSIERGHNPATFTLVAAGGAGPMHGADVARALGCRRALLPRAAGAFCAHGHAAVRRAAGLSAGLPGRSRQGRPRRPRRGLRRARGARPRALAARVRAADSAIEREVDLRYDGQQWPVRVALDGAASTPPRRARPSRPSISACSATSSPAAGSTSPRCASSAAAGSTGRRPPRARRRPRRPTPREKRKVWIDPAHGWRDVPVYDGADLRPGCTLRRSAADRGTHHHRLRRPARPARGRSRATTSWFTSEPTHEHCDDAIPSRSIPSPWRWCRTGSTTSRTRWAG